MCGCVFVYSIVYVSVPALWFVPGPLFYNGLTLLDKGRFVTSLTSDSLVFYLRKLNSFPLFLIETHIYSRHPESQRHPQLLLQRPVNSLQVRVLFHMRLFLLQHHLSSPTCQSKLLVCGWTVYIKSSD